MKTIQEALAEIDRLFGTGPDDSYDAALEELKSFILSNECGHDWRFMPDRDLPYYKCTKCRAMK